MTANFDYTNVARLLVFSLKTKDEKQRLKMLDLMEKEKEPIRKALEEAREKTPFIGSIRFSNIGNDGEIPEKYSKTMSGIIISIPENEGGIISGINLSKPSEEVKEYLNTTPVAGSRIIFSIYVDNANEKKVLETAEIFKAVLN